MTHPPPSDPPPVPHAEGDGGPPPVPILKPARITTREAPDGVVRGWRWIARQLRRLWRAVRGLR